MCPSWSISWYGDIVTRVELYSLFISVLNGSYIHPHHLWRKKSHHTPPQETIEKKSSLIHHFDPLSRTIRKLCIIYNPQPSHSSNLNKHWTLIKNKNENVNSIKNEKYEKNTASKAHWNPRTKELIDIINNTKQKTGQKNPKQRRLWKAY